MEYVLTFNQPLEEIRRHEDPVLAPPALAPWIAYMDDLKAAGVMRGGNRLAPPNTARTVRIREGKSDVQHGAFANTAESASGYVVIEVLNLDEALKWASRSPSSSTGSTEVRPVSVGRM